jgi:phosphopantetheinyl transferase (holo-ACP synthase)
MIVGIGLDVVDATKVRELLAGQSLTHSAGVAAAAVILEG